MTVWVLFVWFTVAGKPEPHPYVAYTTEKECKEQSTPYKKATCVKVVVPK